MQTERQTGRASRTRQISVRLKDETDLWLENHAGGKQKKAAFVRSLIEREMEQEQERKLLKMFNQAAEEVDQDEREEREALLDGFVGEG